MNPQPDPPLTGGCQCGQIRYEIAGQPGPIYVCHCLECRRQSASAFGISVTVKSADLRLIRGTPRRWSRRADTGRPIHCHFCADCGSRVWHGDLQQQTEVSVKGGSLDRPVDLEHAIHIWTSRKLPGVIVPGGTRGYAGEPDETGE